MTVKELKQLLKDVDDNMLLLIPASTEFDGRFLSPCVSEGGPGEMGLDEDEDEFETNFLIVPHGFFDERHGPPPELN